jgi:hypothetical protein
LKGKGIRELGVTVAAVAVAGSIDDNLSPFSLVNCFADQPVLE